MSRELRIAFDTGVTVTAAVYNAAGQSVATPTITESPTGSGLFAGDFPSVAAGVYDVVFESGGYVVGADTIVWTGTAVATPDSAAIASIAEAIETAISSGGLKINVNSPVAGDGTILLARGDDYLTADGRGLSFAFTDAPNLTGATVTLDAYAVADDSVVTVTGTVTGSTVAMFQIPHTTTSTLYAGTDSYTYAIRAILADGSVVTLGTGTVTVTD